MMPGNGDHHIRMLFAEQRAHNTRHARPLRCVPPTPPTAPVRTVACWRYGLAAAAVALTVLIALGIWQSLRTAQPDSQSRPTLTDWSAATDEPLTLATSPWG